MRPTWMFVAMLMGGCGSPEQAPPTIRPVRTIVPAAMKGELSRTFRGAVQASDEAAIGFKVGGRLSLMNVEVGDLVTAGQLLAELDSTELQLQLSKANAALAQAQASARVAKTNRDRFEALYVNNNASAADVDAARANADATAAQTVASARQRDLAAQQLDDAQLHASRAGAVAKTIATEGELVGAGNPVVVITSGDRLEVLFAVPGTLIARVSRGMTAAVRLQTDGGDAIPAAVTEVAVVASGGTFPVTAVFQNATDDLRAGQPVVVDLIFPAQEDNEALVIPLTAVGKDDTGSFVWVASPTESGLGSISRVPIETGTWNADGIEITDGLTGQERVVTAGVSRVFDGQVVRLDDEAAP
jgi:membrane fusion protein, multidrug efflux system